jgi:hypothetical protein
MNRYCVIVLVVGCWSFLGGCKRSDDTTDTRPPADHQERERQAVHQQPGNAGIPGPVMQLDRWA